MLQQSKLVIVPHPARNMILYCKKCFQVVLFRMQGKSLFGENVMKGMIRTAAILCAPGASLSACGSPVEKFRYSLAPEPSAKSGGSADQAASFMSSPSETRSFPQTDVYSC